MISCQYPDLGTKKIETKFNVALKNVKEGRANTKGSIIRTTIEYS